MKKRKHYSPEEKVAILRRHLLEKEPISKLCDELGLQPTVFYRWQKELFENGTAAFEQRRPSNCSPDQERIAYLEKKIQTKDEVLAELMAEHVALRNAWGTLNGVWVPHDTRDQIVDFVRRWSEKTEIGAGRFIEWLDITASKFYDWRERYGKVNEPNGWVPRDFRLEEWEKQAIIGFHPKNPLEGYRRLTFIILDADIVPVSPSSVWRVLSQAGLLSKWSTKPSKKGTGFAQAAGSASALAHRCFLPQHRRDVLLPVQHPGRFQPVHRELGHPGVDDRGRHRDHIAGSEGEVPGSAASHHLGQRPAVHRQGLQGVHSDLGNDARPNLAVSPAIDHYNNVHLNSATGYITPKDMLAGRQQEIHTERDRKLETVRKQSQIRRRQAA
jgi:putative transposase